MRQERKEKEEKKERKREEREEERNVVSNWSQDQLGREKDSRVRNKNRTS